MHEFENKLFCEMKQSLCKLDCRKMLIGVSGGADSVALLRGLHRMQNELGIEVVAAHFNHQTRGEQSAQDAIWVQELAKQLSLGYFVGLAEDYKSEIKQTENRPEEMLREQRFQFLTQIAKQQQASVICLAHHADDQAETVLHHILRGTSLQGLQGIPASRSISQQVTLLHPMLKIRRSEILKYIHALNQSFCTDASNADPKYTRNRIRHEVLPLLHELNPQASQHLVQLSQQACETLKFFQHEVEKLKENCVLSIEQNLVRLKAPCLESIPLVLLREFFRNLWSEQNWPRKKMTFQQWEKISLFVNNDQSRLDLPARITATKRGEMIVLDRTTE